MADSIELAMTVNGKPAKVKTAPDRPLLEVLREDLQLTGTKYGCGEGACGACSVLVDGKRIFSCSTPVSELAGKSITTIEGLASGEKLHPLQEAFLSEEAFQCAHCSAGMIITAAALLKRTPHPSDEEIASAMDDNLCRCCVYPKITAAIKRASAGGTA
jgi:aerobic-type carbon monoxide dehydrogenase small subunit (CoxS/CutS family)